MGLVDIDGEVYARDWISFYLTTTRQFLLVLFFKDTMANLKKKNKILSISTRSLRKLKVKQFYLKYFRK